MQDKMGLKNNSELQFILRDKDGNIKEKRFLIIKNDKIVEEKIIDFKNGKEMI